MQDFELTFFFGSAVLTLTVSAMDEDAARDLGKAFFPAAPHIAVENLKETPHDGQ